MADAKISALTAWTTPIGADYVPVVDSAAVATKKITLVNLGLIDGWIPASESWSYASANTITVPSGAAAKYAVSDRIKFTQTTVKYGVIISVADTVLTIAVNTDHVVADAAISLNYYSHQANPVGYPHWFAITPSFVVSTIDNGSGGQPTITEFRGRVDGNKFECHFRGTGYKAGAGTLIGLSLTGLPTKVNTSNYMAVGIFFTAYGATTVTGIFESEGDGNLYAVCNASIADNSNFSSGFGGIFSYEI